MAQNRVGQAVAEGLRFDGLAKALGYRGRVILARRRQQHDELLAAEATASVSLGATTKSLRDAADDGIAREMPVDVVDVAQKVEVGDDQRQLRRSVRAR